MTHAVVVATLLIFSAAAPAGNVLESAKLVPEDVGVFIAVDHAAELRRAPVGGFALAMIDSVAGFTQTFEAWDRLSAELGWTPAQAFDSLLGNRVVFAAKNAPHANDADAKANPAKVVDPARTDTKDEKAIRVGLGGVVVDASVPGGGGAAGGNAVATPSIGAWVLMSEISAETAARVSARIKPMPRQLVAGSPVLSIENGRFLLGLAKRASDPGDPGAGGFTMMVVEAANEPLLLTALREAKGGAGPARNLWNSGRLDELRPLAEGADAVVSVDFGAFGTPHANAGAKPVPGWLGAAARRSETGVTLQSVMVLPGRPAPIGREVGQGKGWSAEAFDALAKTALFASVESNSIVASGPLGRTWHSEFESFASMIGVSADLPQRAGLTGRLVSLLQLSETGEFDGAVAIESDSIPEATKIGDAEMAQVVAKVAFITGAAEPDGTRLIDPAAYDLSGLPPVATRSLDVSGITGAGLAGMWTGGAKLVWRYVPSANPRPPDAGGWWIAGLGKTAVDTLAKADLTRKENEPRIAWNSMVSARPKAAVERLDALGVPLPRPVEALKHVDRVTWYSLEGARPEVLFGGGRVDLIAR